MEKNDAQISRVAVVKKLQFLEKNFFQKKKNLPAYKTYKTVCGNFFKINGSRDI